MSEMKCLLSAWFCPFAQRAWIAANMLPAGSIQVINDSRSMVADTDDGGIHRDPNDKSNHYDDITRYMLKGELLGDRAVPTLLTPGRPDISGDSIAIARTLLETSGASPELYSDTAENTAKYWSEQIVAPFYNSFGNKEGKAQEFFDILLANMALFGAAIEGPFFYGKYPSLVDITIYPFVFRIVTQHLYSTYRSNELTEASLALLMLEVPSIGSDTTAVSEESSQQQYNHMINLHTWLEECNHQTAFVCTLPSDAQESVALYSPKLVELYRIYAMGIGLKGLYSGKIGTINVHND